MESESISSDAELLSALKLKYDKQVKMYNGSLECVFTSYQVRANDNASLPAKEQNIAEPFVNRLKKNEKQLKKWVKQEGIDSYRLYDADIPEYNVAIDRYKITSSYKNMRRQRIFLMLLRKNV